MRKIALAMCLMISVSAVAASTPHDATHKQTRIIKPTHDGKPIALNTFCLDVDGNILACVGGTKAKYVTADDGTLKMEMTESPRFLQTYSPEGKLIQEVELPFTPTAVNVAPNKSIFVAGDGKVAHVSQDGKLLATADSPHLGDLDALQEKAKKDVEEQMAAMTEVYSSQIERLEKSLKRLKEKEEPSKRDLKRMKSLEAQLKSTTAEEKGLKEEFGQYFSVDAMLARAKTITSLGVNSKYVFLCCGSGNGYDVWRMNHEFSEPRTVAEGLGGCCGQCDIQVTENNLVLAENTKFQVGLLDLDGKRESSFGSRDRSSKEGFGSCCNPMNVRCCNNGDILTAESSIGSIKRFDSNGDLVGVIGKAKIGGGCKHVALGFDEKRDHYYIQYQDQDSICVLVPFAEAPEFTEDELKAKAAKEGLAKKLVGDNKTQSSYWTLDGKFAKSTKAELALAAALKGEADLEEASELEQELILSETSEIDEAARSFQFFSDGNLELIGGASFGKSSWAPVSQDLEKNTLVIASFEDGVQYYNYKIKFVDDNTAEFAMMYGDATVVSKTYKRVSMAEVNKAKASK